MPLSTSPDVAYIVQSVPSRRKVRSRLLDQLPRAVVVEDDGPPPGNPWRGYRRCLETMLANESWTHAVVIQDDALVCWNFEEAVGRVIGACPDHPVVLFYPGYKMHSTKNRQRGGTLFRMHRQDFLPVVAILWPREKARLLYEWTTDVTIPGLRKPYRSDDAVSGAWMKLTRQDVYATMPSLVQHPDDVAPVKDGSQVAGHGRDKGRVAFQFCEGDPLDIVWAY